LPGRKKNCDGAPRQRRRWQAIVFLSIAASGGTATLIFCRAIIWICFAFKGEAAINSGENLLASISPGRFRIGSQVDLSASGGAGGPDDLEIYSCRRRGCVWNSAFVGAGRTQGRPGTEPRLENTLYRQLGATLSRVKLFDAGGVFVFKPFY